MKAEDIEKQYQCGGCQTVHTAWEDARDCCPVTEVYECPKCQSANSSQSEAWHCCLADDECQRAEHVFNCMVDGQEDDELFIAHHRLGEALDAIRTGEDTPAPLEEFFQRSQSLIDFNGLFLAEEQTEERQEEADKTWNDFVDSFNAATRSLL